MTALKTAVVAVTKLIGRKGLFWLAIATLAGLGLSFIEAGLATFLQLFLKTLGVTQAPLVGFKFLAKLDASPKMLVLLLLVIGVSRAVFQFVVQHAAWFALESIGARLRMLAVHAMLYNEAGEYVSAASVHHLFEEVFPKTGLAVYYIAQALPLIFQSAALVLFLIITGPTASAVGLPGLLVIGLIVFYVNGKTKALSGRAPEQQKALAQGVERVARNWLFVKVTRLERREMVELASNILSYSRNSVKMNLLTTLGSSLPNLMGIVLLITIILIGSNGPRVDGMALVSFLYLFLRLIQSLGVLSYFGGMTYVYLPQLKASVALFDEMDRKAIAQTSQLCDGLTVMGNYHGKLPDVSTGAERSRTDGKIAPPAIRVAGVAFEYKRGAKAVFNDLTLSVEPGGQLGIVGKSGSGKSTLLAILLGVLRPTRGQVFIGNEDAHTFLERHADRVGFVGAEPFLVMGSIRDNLNYGTNGHFSAADYHAALDAASLLKWVESLPEGLDYFIDENRSGLSAGQKQRLALARALLKKPLLLVLDEVTANLDKDTEQEIANTLGTLKGKTTVLLVSHRPEILVHADCVLSFSGESNVAPVMASVSGARA